MEELCKEEISGHYLGGGEITACVVIRDQLFVAIKSNILSYCLKSGALLHIQHTGWSEITGICLSPINTQQLITTSKNGIITVWDMTDWTEMRNKALPGVFISDLLVSKSKDNIYVVARYSDQGKEITAIKKMCPTTLAHKSDILIIRKPCDNFIISPCGLHVLFTRDTRVRVINTHTCATFTRYTHDADLVAACVHASQNIAAVGDVTGKICILQDWNVKGCDKVEKHHWHANQLGDLSFAPRSDVLFTGGTESVLVKWLDGEPQFLPRIGSPIQHVLSPDNGQILVLVTDDSMVHIVSLNTWSIKHRITNVLKNVNTFKGGIVSTGESDTSVIFAGTHGNLQVFDTDSRTHRQIIDITRQNKATGHDRNKKLVYIDVTHFQVSGDGEWLVTVERRDDGFVTPECRLKFWEIESGVYTLRTCVDPPHYKIVTGLSIGYTSSHHTAVTTSKDCDVKVWQIAGDTTEQEEGEDSSEKENVAEMGDGPKVEKDKKWILSQVLRHRTGPAFCSKISADGTVAAVAYKGAVVLYSTDDWGIRGEIPQAINQIDQIHLSGYYLLTSAKDLISVWNLTSLSLWWEVSCSVSHILHLPDKTFIAFVARKSVTDAYIFTAKSSTPVKVHTFVCPGRVVSAVWVRDKVVMLNEEQEVYLLSDIAPPPIALSHIEEEDSFTSIFTELLKISANPGQHKHSSQIRLKTNGSKAADILDMSCSALPPIASIAANILEDFLPRK